MTFGSKAISPNPVTNVPVKPGSEKTLMVLGLAAVGLLLFIRNPHVVFRPQFWYEDISVFFLEQRAGGFSAILKTYAGYLLLFPRMVAAGATLFPLEFTPMIYGLGACAGWLWVGWLVLTSPLFATIGWAVFAMLAWIAVPHGGEVFLNLTNVQWALAAGLTLILSEDSFSPGQGPRRIFIVIAGLTGPFCSILAPLALWRLWKHKKLHGLVDWTAILALTVAAIQILIVLGFSSRAQWVAEADPSRLSLFLFIAVFPELFGTKTTFPADLFLRLAGTVAGMAGALWAAGVRVPGSSPRSRLLVGAGLLLLVGLASCLAMNGGAPLAFRQGQRYLFLPFALYVWALISAASHCPSGERTKAFAWVLLAVIGLHSSSNFIAPRYPVPDWAAVCRSVRAGNPIEIITAPFDLRFTIPPDHNPQRPIQLPKP